MIAIVSAAVLPSTLSSARFLTEEERTFARSCLVLDLTWAASSQIPPSVERFRTADITAASAPLSEPAQNIRTHEKDAEKDEDRRVEDVSIVDSIVVHQEDEKFEWREVVRGACKLDLVLAMLKSFTHVVRGRPGRRPNMAHGYIILGYDSRAVLVLIVPVRQCFPYMWESLLTPPTRPTIVAGLGYSGGKAQLHTGLYTPRDPFRFVPHRSSQCRHTFLRLS